MITVAGGAYLEICAEPNWRALWGSGLRAAAVIRYLGGQACLHTFADSEWSRLLTQRAAEMEVGLDSKPCERTIRFYYRHGLSVPEIEPDPRRVEYNLARPQMDVEAENVVAFGFIEAGLTVKARRAVFDPQSPSAPLSFRKSGSVASELAIVANRSELKLLSGMESVEDGCREVLKNEQARVVVAKLGADGCLVVTNNEAHRVPAFKTRTVFPIGSGDVFSAAFAYGWMELGHSYVEAALFASRAAAVYCESKDISMLASVRANVFEALNPKVEPRDILIYLAGPFFNPAQRWLIEELRSALLNAGVNVFSPFHDVGRGSASDVYAPDIEALKRSNVVLAWLDGLDSGTLYEIGYAQALNIPVVAFVSSEQEEDMKMIHGGGCHMVDDITTAIYKTVWLGTCG